MLQSEVKYDLKKNNSFTTRFIIKLQEEQAMALYLLGECLFGTINLLAQFLFINKQINHSKHIS